jgi:type I restriction enzyme S subunit
MIEIEAPYKKTKVGYIPVDWDMKNIGEICIKVQDGNYGRLYPKKTEFLEKGIPFLTSKVLGKHGGINYEEIDYISEEKHKTLKKAHLKTNDILLTNRGASVGAVAKVDPRLNDGNIGPQLTLLRTCEKQINHLFLYHMMRSNVIQSQILNQDSGSAMKFFGIKQTKKFLSPIPPKEEQVKISDILSTWDKAIELKQQLIDLKKEQKKGLMQKLLTGKVRVSTFEDKWKKYKIKDVAESYDKYREPVKASDRIEGETPYYGANGIQGFIDGYTHNGEYVLLAEDGVRDIENYSVFYVNKKIWVNNHAHVLRGKSSLLDTKFLYYSLQVANIKPFLVGGSRAKLNAKAMMKIPLKIPSLMEQKMIVEVLTKFDDEILLLKKELEVRKDQKKGLMQQLLTGKTRVKV